MVSKPAELPLAPVKRVSESSGVQRIGIPAVEVIALAAKEWIKEITTSAEKYAIHAGRKTIKPEDILVVIKDKGITVQMPAKKSRKSSSSQKSVQKPVAAQPAAKQPGQQPQQPKQ
jgi:histone H3/H4